MNNILKACPSTADIVNAELTRTSSPFRQYSDSILKFVCGKRTEAIELRRNLLSPPSDNVALFLSKIPPSETHLFDENKVEELLRTQSSILEPTHALEFLGIGWNTEGNRRFIPQWKIRSIREELQRRIESRTCTWKQAKSILGGLFHRIRYTSRVFTLSSHLYRQQSSSRAETKGRLQYSEGGAARSLLVVGQRGSEITDFHSSSNSAPVSRRLRRGLGCTSTQRKYKWYLDQRATEVAYKQKGVVCSFRCSKGIQENPEAKISINPVRPLDC
nr:unnamed protein product [Callosobruchus analis]